MKGRACACPHGQPERLSPGQGLDAGKSGQLEKAEKAYAPLVAQHYKERFNDEAYSGEI